MDRLFPVDEEGQSGYIAQKPEHDHDLAQPVAALVSVVAEKLRNWNGRLDEGGEHSSGFYQKLGFVGYEEEQIEGEDGQVGQKDVFEVFLGSLGNDLARLEKPLSAGKSLVEVVSLQQKKLNENVEDRLGKQTKLVSVANVEDHPQQRGQNQYETDALAEAAN